MRRCAACGSELESTRESDYCEACEGERLKGRAEKAGKAAAALAAAVGVAKAAAPYVRKAAPVVARVVRKTLSR